MNSIFEHQTQIAQTYSSTCMTPQSFPERKKLDCKESNFARVQNILVRNTVIHIQSHVRYNDDSNFNTSKQQSVQSTMLKRADNCGLYRMLTSFMLFYVYIFKSFAKLICTNSLNTMHCM